MRALPPTPPYLSQGPAPALVPGPFSGGVLTVAVSEGDHRQSVCDCCGQTTDVVSGFVYRDGDAYAAYRATWAEDDPERTVSMAIGLGLWGEGTGPDCRRTMVVRMRVYDDQFQLGVQDAAAHDFWPEVLGLPLSREEALGLEIIQDYWRVADTIVEQDPHIGQIGPWMAGLE